MPNWVQNRIEFHTSNKEIIKQIEENRGICQLFRPMPKELERTQSPARIVTEEEYQKGIENQTKDKPYVYITKEIREKLITNYGYDNWYDWKCENWGTKWGECDFTISEKYKPKIINGVNFFFYEMSFDTAWTCIKWDILEEFARHKDINLTRYLWHEEQGYGEEYSYSKGDDLKTKSNNGFILLSEWENENKWEDDAYISKKTNKDFYKLTSDIDNPFEGFYKAGFYEEHDFNSKYDEEIDGELNLVEESKEEGNELEYEIKEDKTREEIDKEHKEHKKDIKKKQSKLLEIKLEELEQKLAERLEEKNQEDI